MVILSVRALVWYCVVGSGSGGGTPGGTTPRLRSVRPWCTHHGRRGMMMRMTLGPSCLCIVLRLEVVITTTFVLPVRLLYWLCVVVLCVRMFRIGSLDAFAGATTGIIVTHCSESRQI